MSGRGPRWRARHRAGRAAATAGLLAGVVALAACGHAGAGHVGVGPPPTIPAAVDRAAAGSVAMSGASGRLWTRSSAGAVRPWFAAMFMVTQLPLVPTELARLDQQPIDAVIPPVAIRIPAHGVSSPVVPVGVETATGELAVPADPAQVGWYRFGSSPGSEGAAVLAGHVDWKGRPGAFIDLDLVQPGERVEVDLGDGSSRAFVVTERRLIAKTALPPELFMRDGAPTLVLITCGGEYDRSIRRYRQNVVVTAIPV